MFPIIKNINDIQDTINTRKEIAYREYPEYGFSSVWYYMAYPGMFTKGNNIDIFKECRGLVFDLKTGNIISRKYQKSFNLGEDNQDTNWLDFWWMEKLDGTMISFIPYENRYIATTKAGRSDVAIKADIWSNIPKYKNLLDVCLKNNWTAIFEYCGPNNVIIIPYSKEEMILTAIRHNITGHYVYNPDELMELGKKYDIPVVKSLKGNPNTIQDDINKIINANGIEGDIVRFLNGNMIKVKAKSYITSHNLMELFSQEKNILLYILEEKMDDALPMLPIYFQNKIKTYQIHISENLLKTTFHIKNILISLPDDKKEFIFTINENKDFKEYKNILIALYQFKKDDNIDDIIFNTITQTIIKNSHSLTKINNIRYLFGNIVFEK